MAEVRWIEVWTELWSGGLRLRLLRGMSDGSIELRDPHRGGKVIGSFSSLEEAEIDMLDEEFVQIMGRLEDLDAHDFAPPHGP